jgi:hypothetical protein
VEGLVSFQFFACPRANRTLPLDERCAPQRSLPAYVGSASASRFTDKLGNSQLPMNQQTVCRDHRLPVPGERPCLFLSQAEPNW